MANPFSFSAKVEGVKMRANKDDYPCRVVDRRTGNDIKGAIWADDVTGEVERLILDKDGIMDCTTDDGEPRRELLTGQDLAVIPLPGSPLFKG